jgi:hypothetical protein
MKVPPDVTLGWTDDNYGYIRELPNAEEQKRPGGSGLYYHVSYWGAPHDYLWLCTTPPALLEEELTKAYDHGVRKYWILNVGDLKPAELDIDYFMQLATDEPRMAALTQREFLTQWLGEQFPPNAQTRTPSTYPQGEWPGYLSWQLTDILGRYYALNSVRKPEFMGFNGYNDGIKRTEFNPLAWGGTAITQMPPSRSADVTINSSLKNIDTDQNHLRAAQWSQLSAQAASTVEDLPSQYASAFFELVGYPVEAAAAMNDKFLAADRTYLDAHNHDDKALATDSARAKTAYDEIQSLTARYNSLEGGKWDGMMSDHPRDRHVFEMPKLATAADADAPLPAAWSAGSPECQAAIPAAAKRGPNSNAASQSPASVFVEQHCTVSINATHFSRSGSGNLIASWHVLDDLGISGASVVFGNPGRTAPYMQISTAAGGPSATSGGPSFAASSQRVGSIVGGGLSPSLEYDFTTTSSGPAMLALHLLPTFPIDSDHQLRYAVSLDGATPVELNAAASPNAKSTGSGDGPSTADWSANVLRNSAIATLPLGALTPGKHTLRLFYRDPGVVFQHIVITFSGAPPAYPVPPETR